MVKDIDIEAMDVGAIVLCCTSWDHLDTFQWFGH